MSLVIFDATDVEVTGDGVTFSAWVDGCETRVTFDLQSMSEEDLATLAYAASVEAAKLARKRMRASWNRLTVTARGNDDGEQVF